MQALTQFRASVAQCESLIANAHRNDAAGVPLFPAIDREQITVAAFQNMFIAWETFLESSLAALMIGTVTINGTAPVRFVSPNSLESAKAMIIGVMKYFDYANQEYLKRIVRLYFENGYPYEPHISSMFSDLSDLKTMRNASAHLSSTTQTSLESLAVRLFGQPQPGISLYQMLTMASPQSPTHDTILAVYKNKLMATAELIANG
jgi:hypothetical protein